MKFWQKDRLEVYHYGADGVVVKESIHNDVKAVRQCLMMGYAVEQANDQIVLPDFTRVPKWYLVAAMDELLKRGVVADDLIAISRRVRGV